MKIIVSEPSRVGEGEEREKQKKKKIMNGSDKEKKFYNLYIIIYI